MKLAGWIFTVILALLAVAMIYVRVKQLVSKRHRSQTAMGIKDQLTAGRHPCLNLDREGIECADLVLYYQVGAEVDSLRFFPGECGENDPQPCSTGRGQ